MKSRNNSLRLKMAYERYNRDIFSVAFHCSGNREDAEDVVQETFVKFSKNLHKLDENQNEKYWLIRVASNLCIDRGRHVTTALRHLKGIFHIGSSLAENDADKVEMSDEVSKMFDGLDRKTKMIMILKYMEEYEYSEISKMLDIPVGTLKSITSRAISGLREDSE